MSDSVDESSPLLLGDGRPREVRRCCSPTSLAGRVTALVLMSLVGFGAFFCFDNPGALQTEIKTGLGVSTSKFASLYAWYSWPNVVLPVIGGFLIDSVFGVRLGTILFSTIILVGQILLSVGGFLNCLWLMDFSRFVFGVGGESLNMAINTYTVNWFKGKELNMVFGFQLSIARVGSTVNFLVMEPIFHYMKSSYENSSALGWTLLIASSFTFMSFISSILLGIMDKIREKKMQNKVEEGTRETDDKPKFSEIRNLPVTFWLLCICTLAYYGSIFPFVSLAQGFFKDKFSFTGSEANFITGLVYLVSAIASPFFGFLIDKAGRNVTWILVAVTTSAVAHGVLAFTFINPYFPIIILGMSYSILASALWSLPALLVHDRQLGTAFGIMQALQNLGTALITMGAGTIVDKHGYFWLEIFFIAWLVVALISTICIWMIDCHTTNYLNLSAKKRDANERMNHYEKIDTIEDIENAANNNTDTSHQNFYEQM